jgi:hypothetical protein
MSRLTDLQDHLARLPAVASSVGEWADAGAEQGAEVQAVELDRGADQQARRPPAQSAHCAAPGVALPPLRTVAFRPPAWGRGDGGHQEFPGYGQLVR